MIYVEDVLLRVLRSEMRVALIEREAEKRMDEILKEVREILDD